MVTTLDTGIGNARNVDRYIFGFGAIRELAKVLAPYRDIASGRTLFLIDEFFKNNPEPLGNFPYQSQDHLIFVSTHEEPITEGIDKLVSDVRSSGGDEICAVVGVGGGITLDTAKALLKFPNMDSMKSK